jgi:hypothetical protein
MSYAITGFGSAVGDRLKWSGEAEVVIGRPGICRLSGQLNAGWSGQMGEFFGKERQEPQLTYGTSLRYKLNDKIRTSEWERAQGKGFLDAAERSRTQGASYSLSASFSGGRRKSRKFSFSLNVKF